MNKPIREITPLSQKDCFYVVERFKSEFTYPLHTHEEIELNFIENGRGVRRVVGDSIEDIGDFDLVLLSGNKLQHMWINYDHFDTQKREVTIQFSPDFIFGFLKGKKQFDSINELIRRSRNGLVFSMRTIIKVYPYIEKITNETRSESGFYSMISFLTLLYELSVTKEYRVLSSPVDFEKGDEDEENMRINKVYDYLNENYKNDIKLSVLADLIYMTPTSFSRYFKLRTGKSLSDYLLDLRIAHATYGLINSSDNISQICYDCGFNNLSNFNRLFKKRKGCSPKEFRNSYKRKRFIV